MTAPTPFMKSPKNDVVKISAKFMRAVDYVLEASTLLIDVERKWKSSSDADIDIVCHLHCFIMAHTGHNGHMGKEAVRNKYHAVEIEAWKLASIYRQVVALEDMVAAEIQSYGPADLTEDLSLLGMDAKTLSSSFEIIHNEYKKLAQ